MDKVYRVKDWDKLFENSQSRKLEKTKWVPVPNKLDGDGMAELLDHRDGWAHYGAWMAILLQASKCTPRGTLLRGGTRPHTSSTLSRLLKVPEKLLAPLLERLVNDIQWLEVVDARDFTKSATNLPLIAHEIPNDWGKNGPELNRKEENRSEENEGASPVSRFVPPSVPEVAAYCAERGNAIDPQRFVDFYDARGWMAGRNKMKDWRAAVRTWEPPKPKSKCPNFEDLLKPGVIQ